jgi:hypothetical protein
LVILGAWLSRTLPFSVLRDELRFTILVLPPYLVCAAALAEQALASLLRARGEWIAIGRAP